MDVWESGLEVGALYVKTDKGLSGVRGLFIPGCVVIRVLYEVTLQDGCRQTWLSSRPSTGKLVMLTP